MANDRRARAKPSEQMTSKPKFLTLNLPLVGLSTLCLGIGTRTLGENIKQYGVLFRLSGAEPKNSGEAVKVFTFGLFMFKKDNRVRAGFIKRHQILVKA